MLALLQPHFERHEHGSGGGGLALDRRTTVRAPGRAGPEPAALEGVQLRARQRLRAVEITLPIAYAARPGYQRRPREAVREPCAMGLLVSRCSVLQASGWSV